MSNRRRQTSLLGSFDSTGTYFAQRPYVFHPLKEAAYEFPEALMKDEQSLLINRDLSWLEFNRRVLEEAKDPSVPLLERVKFLAIFSSNLDEFFMVRVAGLKRQLRAGDTTPGQDGLTPAAALTAITRRAHELVQAQQRCFRR